MHGRERELWQPLLSLAKWLEDHGVTDLYAIARDHALATIQDEQVSGVPTRAEILLQVLAEMRLNGVKPKARQVLEKAREQEPELFSTWSSKGTAELLKRYGLKTVKTDGERIYRDVAIEELRQLENRYGFDLNLPKVESGASEKETVEGTAMAQPVCV
jgi:hypothetical protein